MNIQDVIIRTVEVEKLEKYFNFPLRENEKIELSRFCIYKANYEIDTDCFFSEINPKLHDGKIQFVIDIPCRIKKYDADGNFSMRMDQPDFYATIPLNDYLLISTEVMLVDFIRYNYNPRIISNQNLLMKYINKIEAESCKQNP